MSKRSEWIATFKAAEANANQSSEQGVPTKGSTVSLKGEVIWEVGHDGTPHQLITVLGQTYHMLEIADIKDSSPLTSIHSSECLNFEFSRPVPESCYVEGRLNKDKLLDEIDNGIFHHLWGYRRNKNQDFPRSEINAHEKAEANARLIPAWGKPKNTLVSALRASRLSDIENRLRTASPSDIFAFIEELDEAIAVALPDDCVLLVGVRSLAFHAKQKFGGKQLEDYWEQYHMTHDRKHGTDKSSEVLRQVAESRKAYAEWQQKQAAKRGEKECISDGLCCHLSGIIKLLTKL